ncbi:pyrroline-5-carboxylate reductase [Sinorhizobium kostiense]|uniref:Pyrroline-5-carboxylate reductase n=1 Tax=Sinorhizobium kostiense TaxID=76747 RepID=A0ABS4R0Q5_9HYPH|nr:MULTISPECIES: pyrroline-5-carboxylate reductase [Sinorhizobium]MBP2236484.1 pyrroline-5-carboxylate reductase [Sinorhizobium kostiense]
MTGPIGFLGTGTITRAIITGLLADPEFANPIIVAPRNAEIATDLAATYPQVTIAEDNQAVSNSSEVVFLAVRPQIASDVIPQIGFRDGQLVISLIAATERETLHEWIKSDVELVQAIPLPFVEDREGVTAIFPRSPRVADLFNRIGTAVECETRTEYDLLAAASATMSLYFGLMARAVDWLEAQGLPEDSGRAYLSAHFQTLAKVASRRSDTSLHRLSREYATKGGLNEQVWTDFDQNGGTRALVDALDRVLLRITK